MEKKILFAVMALLVMATGKIWAQTPYALLCPNEGGTTYYMHFLYTTGTVNTGDTGGEIEGGSSDSETLTYTILKKIFLLRLLRLDGSRRLQKSRRRRKRGTLPRLYNAG